MSSEESPNGLSREAQARLKKCGRDVQMLKDLYEEVAGKKIGGRATKFETVHALVVAALMVHATQRGSELDREVADVAKKSSGLEP